MKNFKSSFISTQSSLRQVITAIDQGTAQIALVVDAEQKLIGTVTDGDIRRGLLRGETLESPAEQVMHREFRFVREGVEEQEVLAMMRQEVLHQIPMLDSEGRVVRLFLLEDLLQQTALPNTVVIMAGGEGKRLRPLTKNCPKPMLPVQGKPMLEILLERCKNAGLVPVLFCGQLSEATDHRPLWRRFSMGGGHPLFGRDSTTWDCRSLEPASENPRRSFASPQWGCADSGSFSSPAEVPSRTPGRGDGLCSGA